MKQDGYMNLESYHDQNRQNHYQHATNNRSPATTRSLARAVYCARCNEPFEDHEKIANTGIDELWHLRCFVCAQCFKPFNDKHEYYEFGGRKYCEQDFRTLFAPNCSRCNQYIIGRFVRASSKCWHPNCFLCELCQCPLADLGFIRNKNRALCHSCNVKEKEVQVKKHICHKCKAFIDEQVDGPPLRYKDETYHSYHFNCQACGIELRSDARLVNNDLYCLKCHDKTGVPICGACRRPIESRVVTALGKHWHVEHFACTICERPFLGRRHYEVRGLAYCDEHYYHLFGYRCQTCAQVVKGDVVSAMGQHFCSTHFMCKFCEQHLIVNKSKFYDVNSNLCCKKCYKKFPYGFRKKLAKEKKQREKLAMQQ